MVLTVRHRMTTYHNSEHLFMFSFVCLHAQHLNRAGIVAGKDDLLKMAFAKIHREMMTAFFKGKNNFDLRKH